MKRIKAKGRLSHVAGGIGLALIFGTVSCGREIIPTFVPEGHNVYAVGSGAFGGWSLGSSKAFTKIGEVYTWTGNVDGGGEFALYTGMAPKSDWDGDTWFSSSDSTNITGVLNTDVSVKVTPGYENNSKTQWKILTAGAYTITLDPGNKKLIFRLSEAAVAEPIVIPEGHNVYAIGANEFGGWGLENSKVFIKSGDTYTFTVTANVDDEFALYTGTAPKSDWNEGGNTWFVSLGPSDITGALNSEESVELASGKENNSKSQWKIITAGTYTITLDPAKALLTFKRTAD
ncbi:MAG: hypothetical protein LBS97_06425 [Treponema sp.]|jgi:hypothetical protein|nr:hypothetical protein [Treponema sp.]